MSRFPSPPRSPKAVPKLTPFRSRPQAAPAFSNCRSPRLRKAAWVSTRTELLYRLRMRSAVVSARIERSWTSGFGSRLKPLVTKRSRRPSLSRSSKRGDQVQSVAAMPASIAASRQRPVPVFRKSALRWHFGAAVELSGGSALLSRQSAIICRSARWSLAAMSATRKSMRPSLFTSPKSEPIE